MLKHGGPKMKRKVNKDVTPRNITYVFIVFPSCRNGLAYHDVQISWDDFDFPPTAAKPLFAPCALPLDNDITYQTIHGPAINTLVRKW